MEWLRSILRGVDWAARLDWLSVLLGTQAIKFLVAALFGIPTAILAHLRGTPPDILLIETLIVGCLAIVLLALVRGVFIRTSKGSSSLAGTANPILVLIVLGTLWYFRPPLTTEDGRSVSSTGIGVPGPSGQAIAPDPRIDEVLQRISALEKRVATMQRDDQATEVVKAMSQIAFLQQLLEEFHGFREQYIRACESVLAQYRGNTAAI